MVKAKAFVCSLILGFSAFTGLGAQNRSLEQGYEAFRSRDWSSAALFFRQAVRQESVATDEVYSILIMSEMYAQDYTQAVNDCAAFATLFPNSQLSSYIDYQKGRALHCLGRNEAAVLVLSDFCHNNPTSPMYASALYWLGECFYDDYNFETARQLYQKVVTSYPDDARAQDAQFKLDAIAQNDREQKLLFLLRMTGEEYLSSRENYERQLKQYQTEDIVELRKQLSQANQRISELETRASETLTAAKSAQSQIERINREGASSGDNANVSEEELSALKAKAARLQQLLDEKLSEQGSSSSTGRIEK